MAHLLESMAYNGETPWHGLGVSVSNDLTPEEMLKVAGLDWQVGKYNIHLANGNNLGAKLSKQALVRMSDMTELSIVSDSWNPVQNHEAFEFFNDFVLSGNMEMHTAGSLKNGKMVWALAKVKESFNVFGGDEVDSYLLFSNPHEFGKTVEIRFTPIRVVCNNTLTYALNSVSSNAVRLNHSRKFDGEMVKQTMGFSKERLEMYRQQALFLGSKKFDKESLKTYFDKVFPKTSNAIEDKPHSRNATRAMEVLETQPGHEYAQGTFWHAFNTVTYMTDHEIGRNVDSRLSSAWFGTGQAKKLQALDLALKMAEAA